MNFYCSYVHALLMLFSVHNHLYSSWQHVIKSAFDVTQILQWRSKAMTCFKPWFQALEEMQLRTKSHILKLMFCKLIIQIQQFTIRQQLLKVIKYSGVLTCWSATSRNRIQFSFLPFWDMIFKLIGIKMDFGYNNWKFKT